MIRIRSAYPASKSAPATPVAPYTRETESQQQTRELEIDCDGRTFILRIPPGTKPPIIA